MSNWFTAGIGAALGALGGLFAGAAIGAKVGGGGDTRGLGRVGGTLNGATTGAAIGVVAGSFIGAAIAGPSSQATGGSTIVVSPPTPPSPVLPPAPPTPNVPPSQAQDPVLSDAQSIYAARNYLGQWWAKILAATPAAVNGQSYVPVLTLTNGVPAADPNFVSALSFFQQFVNANATAADFTSIGLPGVTSLPYTNGTLDTYSLQLLQAAAANPSAV